MSDGAASGFSWLNDPSNPMQRAGASINNWLNTSEGVTAGLARSFLDIGRGVQASRQAGGWATPEGRRLAGEAVKSALPWAVGGIGGRAGTAALTRVAPSTGRVLRTGAGIAGAGAAEAGAERLTGTSMIAPPPVSSTGLTRGQQADAARYQGQADRYNLTRGQQADAARYQAQADRMAQPTVTEGLGTNVPEYSTPEWITAMAGLSPTQAWDFERRGREADEAFRRFSEQAEFERERGQLATTARLRGESQSGAGSAVDLQSALARRGLGTSMATSGVGRDFIAGRTAQERAAARGAFAELEARLAREIAQAGAQQRSYLADLRMAEQAQRQENEAAAQEAARQYREWWLSQYS